MQESASRNNVFVLLRKAGVLGIIAEMLDLQTLETAICQFDDICRSIPMIVVQRTLTELFGARWRAYYDAYVEKQNREFERHGSVPKKPCSPRCSEASSIEPHPWGLGYQLYFPREPAMINGYVVMTAIRVLNSIARNCENYESSFLPGEPSECGINRVSFVENGRLVWIKYSPGSYKWIKNGYDLDLDAFNNEYNFEFFTDCEKTARLDGQVILQDNTFAQEAVATSAVPQETCPRDVSGFQNELWDLGASPHPCCLWSNLWEAMFPVSCLNIRGHVFPLTTFDLDCQHKVVLPSTENFFAGYNNDIDYSLQVDHSHFRATQLSDPLRFVKCADTLAVIDLLHLRPVEFHGVQKLWKARLSNGSKYLGAVVHLSDSETNEQTDIILAIWRVAVPLPLLVWKNGVKLLCRRCDWFIDQDWLVVACCEHGARSYRLMSSFPREIDLSPFVSFGSDESVFLKVCGMESNILACNSPETGSFWFLKLRESASGEWRPVPLYLPGNFPAKLSLGARSLTLNASNYVYKVGKRYCQSVTGDLYDICSADIPLETTGHDGIMVHKMDTMGLKVIAIWESPSGHAVTACYNADTDEQILSLWSLSSLGRYRRLKISGEPIRYRDIKLAIFSPDGSMLFVRPHNEDLCGWLILINNEFRTSQPEFSIKKLPCLKITYADGSREVPELKYPVFVAKNTIAIVSRRYWGQNGPPHDAVGTIGLAQVDGNKLEIDCTGIGIPCYINSTNPENKRLYVKRWVDFLREKTRDLEYCSSISYAGKRAALSPGHRFLLYPAERDLTYPVVPQVELYDLMSEVRKRPNDFRGSPASFRYCLKVRRDFRRVPMYRADASPPMPYK